MSAATQVVLWSGLALAATAASAHPPATPLSTGQPAPSLVWQTQGEGEGGEGGTAGEETTADYLLDLDLVLGHLTVGTALFLAGHADMALTHMKHPGDEIYADLVPAFAARGLPGFTAELEALAAAVEAGETAEAVQERLAALTAAVTAARGTPTAREELDAVTLLVRTAADEYGIGVVDGTLANMHEYQDAWGFLQVARDRLAVLAGSTDAATAAAATEALAALDATGANFPDLTGSGPLGHADVIHGAAARVELAALTLR